MFFSRSTIFATALTAIGFSALANDVNVYSYRQPELVKPLFDAFTEQSGITVNVQFLKKGLVEKLVAEGNRSPADVILTVDISIKANLGIFIILIRLEIIATFSRK